MTSIARWKIATAGMAGIALFFALRGGGGPGSSPFVAGGGSGPRPVTGSRAATLRQLGGHEGVVLAGHVHPRPRW